MKLAYVTHGHTNSGGTERILAVKTNYLVERGYDVSIITMSEESVVPFFSFNAQIKFYYLNLSRKDRNNQSKYLELLTKLINNIQPDISITLGVGLSQYLYKVKDRSKKIFEFHFSKYKRKFELATIEKYPGGRFFIDLYCYKRTKLAKQYDMFIVLTEEDKLAWRYINNIQVIPNPITISPEQYSDLSAKRVITIGRNTYQKGQNLLVSIWADVVKKHPDWKLAIFGLGHHKSKLERQIAELGLTDHVELKDPTNDVNKELVNSSIFAFTSRYEGFGLVLVEAMACGVPPVAYACLCGPRDIIRDGEDGLLVDFLDKKMFIKKLLSLIENEEMRKNMSENARINIQRYHIDHIMPKWTKLFDSLIA